MNILLDECTPRVVRRYLPQYNVRTVQEMGWAGLKNGALLAAADGKFDVLITTDKNLRYQQNFAGRDFAVLVLPSNQVPVVERVMPAVASALQIIKPGVCVDIPLP
ncbi:MAG: hypothetical protein ACJ74W_14815 [Pyrinomonadaceae bacterium]